MMKPLHSLYHSYKKLRRKGTAGFNAGLHHNFLGFIRHPDKRQDVFYNNNFYKNKLWIELDHLNLEMKDVIS